VTSQQFLVCDNSTSANFKSWAKAVSDFIRSAGWTNSSDTGQLNGVGGGVGGSAGWAALSTVPGSGAFYYEIFQPGDALHTFYLKLEYGNSSGTNSPTMRLSIGTATNGAGTLTGTFTTAVMTSGILAGNQGATSTFECDFSGTSSRLSILMWRNSPSNTTAQCFAVQRSLNGSGAEVATSSTTGNYVTLWTGGYNGNSVTGPSGSQQSLHFDYGAAPIFPNRATWTGGTAGWPGRSVSGGPFTGSLAFNSSIPVDFLQPCVGLWDFPCTVIGVSYSPDITEGVTFSVVNQYGQTKTYMPTKILPLSNAVFGSSVAVCMEYD
jgi:hypothetical protein